MQESEALALLKDGAPNRRRSLADQVSPEILEALDSARVAVSRPAHAVRVELPDTVVCDRARLQALERVADVAWRSLRRDWPWASSEELALACLDLRRIEGIGS